MLLHNSNIALKSIFSTSIPHNDTSIKSSKVSNFNEACKWLLIAFYFENPLTQIAIIEAMTSIFAKVPRGVVNWYITHWWPHKIVMAHTMICSHIHASKFLQTQATWLHLHHFQPLSSNFMINLSNHCFDMVIQLLYHFDNSLDWKVLMHWKHVYHGIFVQAIHNCLHIHSSHHLAFF